MTQHKKTLLHLENTYEYYVDERIEGSRLPASVEFFNKASMCVKELKKKLKIILFKLIYIIIKK